MRQRKITETVMELFFFCNAIASVLILLGIFFLLLKNTIPAFKEISFSEFFLTDLWNPTSFVKPAYGILSMVVGTLAVTVGALAIAIPLGILTAAFLSDAAPRWAREILKPAVEILAGIPSVVIGFLGIVVTGPLQSRLFGIPNGLNVLNGAVLLAIMSLPTIVTLSEDALSAVPVSYRDASLALGANRWQTLIRVKIPSALSGILASIMLGMGRAIGETMTVLMAAGNALAMPVSLLDPVRTMTATIAIELGEVPYNSPHYYGLFALALVLFLMSFLVNLASDLILERYQEKLA